MMSNLKLKLWVFAMVAATIFVSCGDDDQPTSNVVDFGNSQSTELSNTGSVDVITENTVRYHTINFTPGGKATTHQKELLQESPMLFTTYL